MPCTGCGAQAQLQVAVACHCSTALHWLLVLCGVSQGWEIHVFGQHHSVYSLYGTSKSMSLLQISLVPVIEDPLASEEGSSQLHSVSYALSVPSACGYDHYADSCVFLPTSDTLPATHYHNTTRILPCLAQHPVHCLPGELA
jgi:hypothetical protein